MGSPPPHKKEKELIVGELLTHVIVYFSKCYKTQTVVTEELHIKCFVAYSGFKI